MACSFTETNGWTGTSCDTCETGYYAANMGDANCARKFSSGWNIFFLNIFGEHIHMLYIGVTDSPVLDFW